MLKKKLFIKVVIFVAILSFITFISRYRILLLNWQGQIVFSVVRVAADEKTDKESQIIPIGTSIGIKPGRPRKEEPKSSSIFIHYAKPEQKIDESVVVVNTSNSVRKVKLYPTDSIISSGGGFGCKQELEENVLVGRWILFDKSEIILEPYESKEIEFSILVPQDVIGSEYNGCVVAQEVSNQINDSKKLGINLNYRTAIRVALRIDTDKQLLFDFDVKSVDIYEDFQTESYLSRIKIQNKGNVSVDLDINQSFYPTLALFSALQENGGVFTVFPSQADTELNFKFIKPFWGGFFCLRTTILENKSNISKIDFEETSAGILGTESSKRDLRNFSYENSIFVVPHPIAILVYITIFLVPILMVIYKKRKLKFFKNINLFKKNVEN